MDAASKNLSNLPRSKYYMAEALKLIGFEGLQ